MTVIVACLHATRVFHASARFCQQYCKVTNKLEKLQIQGTLRFASLVRFYVAETKHSHAKSCYM